jgi:NAD-dependent dihydropyrimidine dehydrogenase PreA subunit
MVSKMVQNEIEVNELITIKVDLKKCTGCGICLDVCPLNVYEIIDIDGKQKASPVNQIDCIGCRNCELACPEGAIEIIKNDFEKNEI